MADTLKRLAYLAGRTLAYLFLFICLATVLYLFVELVLGVPLFTGGPPANARGELVYLMIEWSVIALAAFLAVLLFARLEASIRHRPFSWSATWRTFGLRTTRFARDFSEGYGVAAGILLVLVVVLWASNSYRILGTDWQPVLFGGWFVFFLVQPFAEELLFRGVFQQFAQRYFGPVAAVLMASLAFAAVHASNANFTWIGGLDILIGGLLMGLMYMHTQRLWLPTGMHAGWNFLQSTFLGLPVSGIETYSWLDSETQGPDWWTGGAFGAEGSILSVILTLVVCGYYWWKWRQTRVLVVEEE